MASSAHSLTCLSDLNPAGSLQPRSCEKRFIGQRLLTSSVVQESNLAVFNALDSQASGLAASLLISKLDFEVLLYLASPIELQAEFCRV